MLSILIPNKNEKGIEAFVQEVLRVFPDGAEVYVAGDPQGKGKGWAIRNALGWAQYGDYIAYIDGDGDIPPRMFLRMIPFLDDFDIVVGSKSNATAPLHRKIITHLSRFYIRIMFGLSCDTQTGIKIFRREALEYWQTDGFMFDLEILAKAKRRGFNIIEVPVETDIRDSVSRRVLWKALKDSLKIWYRLLFRRAS